MNPLVKYIVGSRYARNSEVGTGSAQVKVTVTGDVGGADTLWATFTVRLLGDIDGNFVVDALDKLEINKHLNGLPTLYCERASDLNGDGVIDAADKLIINQILNGLTVP